MCEFPLQPKLGPHAAATLVEVIVAAMARALFVQAFADAQEQDPEGIPAAGRDWMDLAPPTPNYALLEAYRLLGRIEEKNRTHIACLYAAARRADGLPENTGAFDAEYARLFGHYLAMQSLGHGVSWFDDHERFALELPLIEFELEEPVTAQPQPEDGMVLFDAPESAAFRTNLSGWVSREGFFYGNDERQARWNGCTHVRCSCGEPAPKGYAICESCRQRKAAERYAARPTQPWDGKALLYSETAELFFNERCEIDEHCDEHGCSIADLRLVICTPTYAAPIDPNEHYCDDLPEDREVPAEVEAAFAELNARLAEDKAILSWFPGQFAALL